MPLRNYCLFFVLVSGVMQLGAQSISADTERLHQLYQEFRYPEVILLADTLLTEDRTITVTEKCEILRLLALSYYARQDMQGALKNFAAILELDTHYRLDPLENSPKILAFFEEIRRQKKDNIETSIFTQKEAPPTDNLSDSLAQVAYQQLALSIFVPGSGQIARGQKIKGWLLLAGNVSLLGGFIYFAAETGRFEKQYLQVTNPDKIQNAWEDYNRSYKNRQLFLSAFAVLWLYTH
jgi:TM2 domain-containing membrane protein YozV